MKKYLILFLLIVIFFTGIWLLNNFGVISIKAWGEKAIVNTPFLKGYVKINEDFDLISIERDKLLESNIQLTVRKDELEHSLAQASKKIEEQLNQIEKLNSRVIELEQTEKSREEKLNKLVQIYEKMDSEEAAEIFNSLDRDISLELLLNIKVKTLKNLSVKTCYMIKIC